MVLLHKSARQTATKVPTPSGLNVVDCRNMTNMAACARRWYACTDQPFFTKDVLITTLRVRMRCQPNPASSTNESSLVIDLTDPRRLSLRSFN